MLRTGALRRSAPLPEAAATERNQLKVKNPLGGNSPRLAYSTPTRDPLGLHPSLIRSVAAMALLLRSALLFFNFSQFFARVILIFCVFIKVLC